MGYVRCAGDTLFEREKDFPQNPDSSATVKHKGAVKHKGVSDGLNFRQ